jgi:putative transposase
VVGPIARREEVGRLRAQGTSLRRACRLIGLSTSTWRYDTRIPSTSSSSCATGARERAAAIRRSAAPHTGRSQGLHANHKRVYGVYREAKLQVRRRPDASALQPESDDSSIGSRSSWSVMV